MRMLKYRECNITPWHQRIYFTKILFIRKLLKLINSNYDYIFSYSRDSDPSLMNTQVWEFRCDSVNLTKYFLTKTGAEIYLDRIDLPTYTDYSIVRVPLFLILVSD